MIEVIMKIQILTDNIKSWFIPYGHILKKKLEEINHEVSYVYNKTNLLMSDICFFLSCSSLIDNEYLNLNKHNIVIHASDLPYGKGFSPLQWQILEGKDEIKLTLFEAVEKCDAGPYYFKSNLVFDGSELYNELREKLAQKIILMCIDYVANIDQLEPIKQAGEESIFRRRKTADDEIDIHKTIAEQFNHFRIADNDNFPLYFHYRGCSYLLKIYKRDNI